MASVLLAEERWELLVPNQQQQGEEHEQEEEALSLCDLPINLIEEEKNQARNDEIRESDHQEDFDFNNGSWRDGSVSQKSEMCSADDIFFQGQILPFRLSVSSESSLSKFKHDTSLNPSRSVSRSESMDHSSQGGFTSRSSSSSRSGHYSSSSSTANSAATTTSRTTTRISKSRIQKNQFNCSHPSPKPQIRLSTSASLGSSNRNRNSSVWEFFRVGLVRTPGIEFQDLKARNSVSRNSSSGSSNSNSSIKNTMKTNSITTVTSQGKNAEKQRKQSFLEIKGGLLSGCSCSSSAVKPLPLNMVVVKSRSSTGGRGNDGKSDERGAIEEKLQEMTKKKKRIVEKQQQQQQGKQATSRHRTFEWIKELSHSHASFVDDEETKLS